jgi:hypothetical protein
VLSNPPNTLGPAAQLGIARFDVDSIPVKWVIAEMPAVWGSLKSLLRTLQSCALKTGPRTDACLFLFVGPRLAYAPVRTRLRFARGSN